MKTQGFFHAKKSIPLGNLLPKEVFLCVRQCFIKTDILQRMDINDKNNRLISKMMKPLHKAVNIIVKGIAKKKGRIVLGFDGRSMDFLAEECPKLPRLSLPLCLRNLV